VRVLVTGSAGFIGHALCRRYLAEGHEVTGFDGFTPYYDPALKHARHADLATRGAFRPVEAVLDEAEAIRQVVDETRPDIVLHLAAQAGVRYGLENPQAYVGANLLGMANLLEALRAHPPRHLLFASTSSAYGGEAVAPFRETDRAATPLSFYAATKIAGEAMAHSYAHLFAIPTTAFRFFTVYGPWGRPDMALFLFTRQILAGEPIAVFGQGRAIRDFTYIDDLVDAVSRLAECIPAGPAGRGRALPGDSLSPVAPFRLVNVGGGQPRPLSALIDVLEEALGIRAERLLQPLPPGDVGETHASTELLRRLIGTVPTTPIETGIPAFVEWYRRFYAA
jgi:UDP-glucuronate 4-epimerase